VTLSLLDDSILAFSVAISAGCVVVLFAFLARYRALTSDVAKSSQLAKNIWDAMNSRLSVMDARIIDAMAKAEIHSAQSSRDDKGRSVMMEGKRSAPLGAPSALVGARIMSQTSRASQDVEAKGSSQPNQEIEVQILQSLVEGPKKSSEIKQKIDRSREHTARLMKTLFERGLVVRNEGNRPYVYEITEGGRRYLENN